MKKKGGKKENCSLESLLGFKPFITLRAPNVNTLFRMRGILVRLEGAFNERTNLRLKGENTGTSIFSEKPSLTKVQGKTLSLFLS